MSPARAILARHGLNCTVQRASLYEALRATTSHPTAEELYQLVRPKTRSLSLATVYSTLEVLCRVGLARKVPTLEGSCRYDAATAEHVHLRREDTGEIEDVPPELGDRILAALPRSLIAEVERAIGVAIDGIDVQLTGRRPTP